MKVYVITNQADYHDGGYYDVVAVTRTFEDARSVVGTSKKDFLEGVDNGGFAPDFSGFSNLEIEEEDNELTMTDKTTGYFEKFIIEELEMI